MGFLSKFFYRPPPYRAYVASIHHAANELERTFRGMLTIHNEDIENGIFPAQGNYPVEPSPLAIITVRLFAAHFWPIAYKLAYDSVIDEAEFIGVVSKTAWMGSSIDSAHGLSGEMFTIKVRPIIVDAFKEGPMIFGAPLSPAHARLVGVLHEILANEIGINYYTPKVRERWSIPVEANVLRLLNDPMELFRRSDARDPTAETADAEDITDSSSMEPLISFAADASVSCTCLKCSTEIDVPYPYIPKNVACPNCAAIFDVNFAEGSGSIRPLVLSPINDEGLRCYQVMKLITLKCQYCGLTAKMPNDDALIMEQGPTDLRGLNHFYLYCRRCHMISDSIGPTIFQVLLGKKFDHQQILDPAKMVASDPQFLNILAPKIQQAMRADGII